MRALLVAICVLAVARAGEFAPLDIRGVKVRGEIGRRIGVTIRNNMLAADTGRDFLAPFAERNRKGGYIGLGKLIMSAVRFAAYQGGEAEAFRRSLVERTIALQQPDGYIGLCEPASRITALWDVHETGYIVAGLTLDYEYFKDQRSLDAARRAADYLIAHWKEIPPDWGERTGVAANVAVTGLEHALLALSTASGDRRYRDFVLKERALREWNLPIIIGRRPGIEGHIYHFVARSLAQLELDPPLAAQADRAVDFLTRGGGMTITGGAGQWEIWTDDQDGRGQLAETCATAYQVRLYDALLRMRGDPRYADLIERTVFNALFAAQSPDGRRIRYYTPFEGPREYHPGDTYCCPGNYRRIVSELPGMIYYRWKNGIAVSQYTESEAKFDSVTVKQETGYPRSGEVVLRVDPERPARFPLRLRIPAWARGASIEAGGGRQPAAAGTFATIEREWKRGDTVRLSLPMPFRLVRGRERQAGRAAVMRGPLVYTLNPSQDAALEKLDAADLGRYTLDPDSLELLNEESGTACRAGAWKPGYGTQAKHDVRLTLTEFPDPGGRAIYFRLRDLSAAVDDELAQPGQRQSRLR
jgi:DUF1680 family protein